MEKGGPRLTYAFASSKSFSLCHTNAGRGFGKSREKVEGRVSLPQMEFAEVKAVCGGKNHAGCAE